MFVPVAVSTVATAIVFNWVFDPTYGIANWLLNEVGIGSQGFFQDPDQALYAIVAMTVWGWIGFDVIIYLAALQGIPHELLEAAAIDGASRWSTFRSVVLPLLGPATLFLVVWSTINALQLFDEIYNTTRGGPLRRPRWSSTTCGSRRSSSSTPATRPRSPTCSSSRSWWSRCCSS